MQGIRQVRSLITLLVLVGTCVLAFFIRLFAIIKFESIIHEFDPWFNYRATAKMVTMGFYDFLNWFDETAWYPLGRVVGGTVYPGLMVTAGTIHAFLNGLGFTTNIQDVCVFTAPIFSGLTAVATYLMTSEVWTSGAGLVAALFIGINPSYASRSVGGSFDNEGISIFALQFSFWLWLRALRTGSCTWSVLLAMSYMYMTSAWGGYVYIINLIALHAFVLILMGRYSIKLYVSYTTFYCIGQLMAMNIPFVGFLPVSSSEHMAGFGVFGLLQIVGLMNYLRSSLGFENTRKLFVFIVLLVIGLGTGGLVALTAAGFIQPWNGRFYSLWDTGYAIIHLPLIASVSEHQPSQAQFYFNDLSILPLFGLAGIWYCFNKATDGCIFLVIYAIFSAYFSGIMVRLMLTLSPILCILAAIGLSETIKTVFVANEAKNEIEELVELVHEESTDESGEPKPKQMIKVKKTPFMEHFKNDFFLTRLILLGACCGASAHYVYHSEQMIERAYSNPTVILSGTSRGKPYIIDDFREAYAWLRTNTDKDSEILSWWDYGYQIAGMADRTTIVDNNTWNNTHIALVGKFFASDEKRAHQIATQLGADYVLILTGAWLGYPGDDMNKFLWMVRIAEAQWPDEIQQRKYLNGRGQYTWAKGMTSKTMENSVMYRMSHTGLTEVPNPRTGKVGYDVTRRVEIGDHKIRLKYFEEAFTSKEVMVRVFRVKTFDELASDELTDVKKSKRRKKTKKVDSKFKKSTNSLLF